MLLLFEMNWFKWQSFSFGFKRKAREWERERVLFYSTLTGHTMWSKFDHKLLLDHFHKSLSAMSLFSLLFYLLLLPQAYPWHFACNWIWSIILLWTQIKAKTTTIILMKIGRVIHAERMCAKCDKDKYWKWFRSMAKLYIAWHGIGMAAIPK